MNGIARCRVQLIGLAIAAFVSTSNVAAAKDTMAMLRECQGREPADAGYLGQLACAAYLSGFIDMHSWAIHRGAKTGICIPADGISNEQAMRVFIAWAERNPKELHQSARLGVYLALVDAFPCPAR